LKESDETFSGLVWTGERSIELGLADALGSVAYVAREIVKAETIVNYSWREHIVERVARRFGASLGESIVRSTGSGFH
jgi:protease-4